MYKYFLKEIIDIFFSTLLLILFFPLFILIGVLIKIDSKGPVFFKQIRLGKDEKLFKLFKFRSMTDKDHDNNGQIFSNDIEITKVGLILRRFKIDELPQLLNVVKGDMSIIGPRPCLPRIKNKFGKYANNRFKVKPGLTSLAAVKGSIFLSWEEKGYYDSLYVKNLSFLLDLRIVLNTIRVLIIGEKKLFYKK